MIIVDWSSYDMLNLIVCLIFIVTMIWVSLSLSQFDWIIIITIPVPVPFHDLDYINGLRQKDHNIILLLLWFNGKLICENKYLMIFDIHDMILYYYLLFVIEICNLESVRRPKIGADIENEKKTDWFLEQMNTFIDKTKHFQHLNGSKGHVWRVEVRKNLSKTNNYNFAFMKKNFSKNSHFKLLFSMFIWNLKERAKASVFYVHVIPFLPTLFLYFWQL